MHKGVLRPVIAFGFMLWIGTVQSAESDWLDAPYAYAVVNQDIRDVMQAFSQHSGKPVVVLRQVHGDVTAIEPQQNSRAFLNAVTSRVAADWYLDGEVITVYAKRDAQVRHFDVSALRPAQVEQWLAAHRPEGSGLTVSYSAPQHDVTAFGPVEFLTPLGASLRALSPAAAPRTSSQVKVYRFHAQ
ncbi:hypothetical protein [Klebsiella pneumoniae]|uniref:hypothetical protein n=1 Tax=Klebsiella pneumoniae TaxID=573 RepID=UPI00126287E7|nr:hypothetical protein [Klebsiella pneumoniae]KAB7536397.1 hypothetical protein GBV82_06425 [Klebsiella pneumoniae]